MTKLSALFITILTLLSGISWARNEIIDIEYASKLNTQFVKQKLKEQVQILSQNLHFSVESFDIGTSPKVQILGLKAQIQPQSIQILNSTNGLIFSSIQNRAEISISEIKIQQTITKKVGGITLNLDVFASCKGLQAHFDDPQSEIGFELQPEIENEYLKIKISNPRLYLSKPRVDLSQLSCTGADGFDQLIQETIQNYLSDSQFINSLLHQDFIEKLNQYLGSYSYKWNQVQILSDNEKFTFYLFPQQMTPLQDGFLSRGILRVRPKYRQTQETASIFFSLPKNMTEAESSFIISETAFQYLIQDYFSKDNWKSQYNSDEIPEFQSLMKSRFKQFFVWADLFNFSKKSIFKFEIFSKQNPQINWQNTNSLLFQTELEINMNAPIQNKYVPYVYFSVPISTLLQFQINQNQIIFKNLNPEISIKYAWDPNYCEKPGTCGSISTKLVSKAIQNYLSENEFKFQIPQLEVLGGVKIKLKSFHRDPKSKTLNLNFE